MLMDPNPSILIEENLEYLELKHAQPRTGPPPPFRDAWTTIGGEGERLNRRRESLEFGLEPPLVQKYSIF
jgi:hypothetical protein